MKTYYYVKQREELVPAFHPIIYIKTEREREPATAGIEFTLRKFSHFITFQIPFLSAHQVTLCRCLGKDYTLNTDVLCIKAIRERDDTQFYRSSRLETST